MSAHDGTLISAFAIALEGECDPRRDVERGSRLNALLEAMSKDQLDAIQIACEQLTDQAGAARIRVYGFDPMPAEPQPYEDPRLRLSADRLAGV